MTAPFLVLCHTFGTNLFCCAGAGLQPADACAVEHDQEHDGRVCHRVRRRRGQHAAAGPRGPRHLELVAHLQHHHRHHERPPGCHVGSGRLPAWEAEHLPLSPYFAQMFLFRHCFEMRVVLLFSDSCVLQFVLRFCCTCCSFVLRFVSQFILQFVVGTCLQMIPLPIHWSVCLSVCTFIHPSIRPPVPLFSCLCPFVSASVFLAGQCIFCLLQVVGVMFVCLVGLIQLNIILTRNPSFWWNFSENAGWPLLLNPRARFPIHLPATDSEPL
jgi:hypothetical protein